MTHLAIRHAKIKRYSLYKNYAIKLCIERVLFHFIVNVSLKLSIEIGLTSPPPQPQKKIYNPNLQLMTEVNKDVFNR